MADDQQNGWSTVSEASKRKGPKNQTQSRGLDIEAFLGKYKTEACTNDEYHDHRTCVFFHDARDMRRNPYREFYWPDDAINQVETMYHPCRFRTYLCKRGESCPFQQHCSFAHNKDDIRCLQTAEGHYEQMEVDHRKLPSLGGAVSVRLSQKSQRRTSLASSYGHSSFSEGTVVRVPGSLFHTEEFLPIPHKSEHWFMINYDPFHSFLEEKALEDGLSRIAGPARFPKFGNQSGILISGTNSDNLLAKLVCFVMLPPSRYFVSEERKYSERVTDQLSQRLAKSNGQELLLGQLFTSAFVELDDERVKVCAKNGKGYRGRENLKLVFEKIDFWIEQVGYDSFLECGCCYESRNEDQGIVCPGGHFFCNAKTEDEAPSCIESMVHSQIPTLHAQQGNIICAMCQAVVEMQQLAKHLSAAKWREVHAAVLDAKVKRTEETLAKEFNDRLEAKIQELMDQYESADACVKMKAEMVAQQARNEALNLKCPHCKVVYAEFDGCMALACGSCKKTFCGYCHKPCADSRGTHEHVRLCDMNESRNGSFYATAEEIERGQRKYRTKQLKKFLRDHKKEIQNATIIELQPELDDLGIEPAALFEFGNLLPE